MKMAELPPLSRPREKGLTQGVSSLDDSELLALLLGNGTKGMSALEIGHTLLSESGGLLPLSSWSIFEFSKIKGLGKAKALTLLAALELGKRMQRENVQGKAYSPSDLYSLYKERKEEALLLLCLDGHGRMKKEIVLYQGTKHSLLVSSSAILEKMEHEGYPSFALVHNHPSGIPLPSKEDMAFTSKIAKEAPSALKDHLIVGKDGYFSFLESGILPMKG